MPADYSFHSEYWKAKAQLYHRRVLGVSLEIVVINQRLVRVTHAQPVNGVYHAIPVEPDAHGAACVRLSGRLIRLGGILPPGVLTG